MRAIARTATIPVRDPWLWVALLAAPLYWAALYALTRPTLDLGWPLAHAAMFLLPALVYPVLEEIVFRGLIQEALARRLRRRLPGPVSPANLVTSLLFTALHFINHAPLAAAAVFVPSLIFGWFKDRHGGLGAPILLHVFYNAGYLWLFAAPA
jgi:uncharacterized protein